MQGGSSTILQHVHVQVTHAYLSRDNFLIDLDGLISEEGRIASSHLVDQHP